eukprot:gene8381-7686_t
MSRLPGGGAGRPDSDGPESMDEAAPLLDPGGTSVNCGGGPASEDGHELAIDDDDSGEAYDEGPDSIEAQSSAEAEGRTPISEGFAALTFLLQLAGLWHPPSVHWLIRYGHPLLFFLLAAAGHLAFAFVDFHGAGEYQFDPRHVFDCVMLAAILVRFSASAAELLPGPALSMRPAV